MHARISICLICSLVWSAGPAAAAHTADIDRVLDALHARAAAADYEGYVALFSDDAVFLGTDREEYWPIDRFKAYARARFETGTGWTYQPFDRVVHQSGDVAWFEERLRHARYPEMRGTGVLVRSQAGWRIAQYNLTLPIPNALFGDVAAEVADDYAAAEP